MALAAAHDPVSLHLFIVNPKPHEVARLRRWYPELRNSQHAGCNYVAAALARLSDYLLQPDTRPERPGRKRGVKIFDDDAAIAEANRLLAEPNPLSKRQAAWAVVGPVPKGASREADFARIYRALRGV